MVSCVIDDDVTSCRLRCANSACVVANIDKGRKEIFESTDFFQWAECCRVSTSARPTKHQPARAAGESRVKCTALGNLICVMRQGADKLSKTIGSVPRQVDLGYACASRVNNDFLYNAERRRRGPQEPKECGISIG